MYGRCWSRFCFVVVCLCSTLTLAQESGEAEREVFRPDHWARGFHFLAASGLSTALFNSRVQEAELGGGASIRMDVGYYWTPDFAVEIGSSVNLNRVEGFLIWDNQFTLGVRARVPRLAYSRYGAPYMRFFSGRGPLIIVFEDEAPSVYQASGAQRLQLEGPVFGASIGYMQTATTGGVWLLELMLTFHSFESLEIVKSNKDVPVVVQEERVRDQSSFSALHILIGVVAF
ncbi:MAG: hypothetical protein NDI61_11540 [Bdellovibrionaceae bacterium]|nr:hypothetical protein [Pseudobdellovibrionaceae bacterium]